MAQLTLKCAGRHTLHESQLGRLHQAARLPIRAAALCRLAGRPGQPRLDQERSPKSALSTTAAYSDRRLRGRDVRCQRHDTHCSACDLRGDKRRPCAPARGSNYILTEEASVTIVDVLPTASIIPDTPLARGEWVRGDQPLNYDASDNGAYAKQIVGAGNTGSVESRPCAFATPDGTFAEPIPCPNGPGQIRAATDKLLTEPKRLSSGPTTRPATSATHSAGCSSRQHAARAGRHDVGRRRRVAQSQRRLDLGQPARSPIERR